MGNNNWKTEDVADINGILPKSCMAFSVSAAGEAWYKATTPQGKVIEFFVSSNSTKFILLQPKTQITTQAGAAVAANLLYVMYGE